MRFEKLSVWALGLCLIVAVTAPSMAAETAKPRDAQSIINDNRMKTIAKELSLTAEQQKQIRALYDDELKQISAIQGDTSLGYEERYQKQMALKAANREKVKALLTDEQKPKWDAYNAKLTKKPAKASKKDSPAQEKKADPQPEKK